jgi:hypothetical protein
LADRGNRPFQVDRVPKHDGGHHQIQPTSPMPLVFVRAVPQLTQPVEEYPPLPRRLSPLLYRGRRRSPTVLMYWSRNSDRSSLPSSRSPTAKPFCRG